MNCKQCGAELKHGAKFCPKCGAVSASAMEFPPCVSCGKPLKPGAKFCPHCGASQLQSTTPEPAQPISASPVGETAVSRQMPAAAPPKPAVSPTTVGAPPDLQKTQGRTQATPVKPVQAPQKNVLPVSQANKAPDLDMQPPQQAAKKRKTLPLWLAGGLAIVALGAGGAWYFQLIPGVSPESTAAKETSVASQPGEQAANLPAEAESMVVEEPVPADEVSTPEPRVAAVVQTSTGKNSQAIASPQPTQPKASARPPAGKPQSQPAASYTPAWASPQGSSPAPSFSGQTAQAEPQKGGGPGEQTQDTVVETPAKTKDPFAKCRKLTGFVERTWCEEKTRFKICQGRWGTAPECPKVEDNSEYQY